MGQAVSANGRSILHKGHGMTHTCAPPDVCKTPSPGGPVPIPYVNVAMDSNITDGAQSVKIEGNPLANVAAKIATSTGDEPGTGGGLISSKCDGTVTWKTGSPDVKAEGKSVVRFLDTALHNGNTYNVAFINAGKTAVAYADDFDGLCPICNKGPEEHRVHESRSTANRCRRIIKKLKAAFRAASDAEQKSRYARKKRKGEAYNGYMVAVMYCRCGTYWAAMSGNTLDGFKEVAKPFVDVVMGGGNVDPDDYIKANTGSAATTAETQKAINAAIADLGNVNKRAGYNAVGQCAAAKVMTNRHAALEMSEMYFMPPRNITWHQTYNWRVFLTDPSQRGLQELPIDFSTRGAAQLPTGGAVGSCHTCQELLFMTNCPKKSCPA